MRIRALNWLSLMLVVSCLCAPTAVAQTTIRGTVTDAETGEPLAAAHVVIEGTYRGTITNREGEYALTLESLPATLLVRSIGFATERRLVDSAGDRTLDVHLQPVSYELDEIVVSGDPGGDIMRRVIEEKRKWYDDLETFRTNAFTRRVVANDTGIVFIVEALSDLYWDRERGIREVITSQRQTENLPIPPGTVPTGEISNLYDDDVEIAGFRLVGVTHPRALDVYDFSLIGTRRIDDQLVFDIGVKPRSRLTPAFVGQVTVLDQAFALLEVHLRPNEAVLLPPPVRQFEIELWQQFSSFGGPFWLPVDYRANILAEISFGVLGGFPEFRLRQVTRLTDYAVNVPVPDSLFDADERLHVDSAAVAADTLLENASAFVPLEPRELAAYQEIDSTDRIEDAFRPRGLLGRFVDAAEDSTERRGRERSSLNFEPILRFNRVEGAHLGARIEPEVGPLRLTLGGGWSSELDGSRRWSKHAGVEVRALPHERLVLSFSAEAAPATRYDSRLYAQAMSSLYTLFGGTDYFDYYWRERLVANVRFRPTRDPLTAGLAYAVEWPDSLQTNTAYDLLALRASPRPNPAIDAKRLDYALAHVTLGDAGYRLGALGSRYVTVSVERGHLADAWYNRFAIEAEYALPVFNRRRLLPASLHLHLTAATSTGRLPLQRQGMVDARLGPYTPFGALRTLGGRPYVGDRHLGLFWEQSLRTLPFEALGLYGLARRGYTILLHGGHARTWLSHDEDAADFRVPDEFHHEVGVSLSGLLGVIRIDFSTRLDAPGFGVGVAVARLF